MDKLIEKLNEKYATLTPIERLRELFNDFDKEKVLVTSSFGTSSVFLLSLLSRVNKNQKVHFIDTQYLFRETIEYKDRLAKLLGLEITSVLPNAIDHEFTLRNETWKTDPDFCCMINKVNPLNKIKHNFDVWVSGVMAFQSYFRRNMKIFEHNGMLKFNPILDVTEEEVREFIRKNKLPEHPLVKQGFGSVGCTHCTVKGEGRNGRWVGTGKTECGLHVSPKTVKKAV
ncbi:MAG TPA: phosphoadenylyl-sulfate reductase [Chitinophagales bacterium]|nr:phosphoadenylyl-sulfate reductase [Chitinophagales bacterium]